jgi:ribosome biogenesis protein Tsr3
MELLKLHKYATGISRTSTGYPDVADAYLKRFGWGPTFITINKELLDIYSSCTDARHQLIYQF